MKREVQIKGEVSFRPLVRHDGFYVIVSHKELDTLVGRLCQLFELNGDVEQRDAIKRETKQRCRDWLDAVYIDSGYDKWTGVSNNAPVFKLVKE